MHDFETRESKREFRYPQVNSANVTSVQGPFLQPTQTCNAARAQLAWGLL